MTNISMRFQVILLQYLVFSTKRFIPKNGDMVKQALANDQYCQQKLKFVADFIKCTSNSFVGHKK